MGGDLDEYFERIGFAGPARPDLETLARIHELHVAAIPFENLAPFLGEPVGLDVEALVGKLVRARRGGWCFEHNLLLAHVLRAIGFEVRTLAARVRWNVPPNVATARSHMLLRVPVEGRDYIADAGFGGLTLTAPLRLVPGLEQPTAHEPHRLLETAEGFALQAKLAGEWSTLYVFDLHEQMQADYEVSNWYLANHPHSQFVRGVIAARAEPGRRHALRQTRYTVHHDDGRTERRFLGTVAEVREVLAGPMRIPLPDHPGLDRRLQAMIDAHPPT